MNVYLDNAATTPLDPTVLEAMMPYFKEHFGNPSSTHQFGRKTKSAIEKVRRDIASRLGVTPSEIVFTSGGTEADNMAILGAVQQLGVKHVITTPIEHHAVTHTVEAVNNAGSATVHMLNLDSLGRPDMTQLEELLSKLEGPVLVSIMHANNEIGTVNDIEAIGNLAHKYGALYHSDTVQTMGHLPLNLGTLPVDFATAAAHKFHGPKGVGFLYLSKSTRISSLIHGGSQERSLRAGTENLYGIVGMGKALELAVDNLDTDRKQVAELRDYFKNQLLETFPDAQFNGCQENALYTVLSVSLPAHENGGMLLFLLDIDGIACSAGSACSSGSNVGSHVLKAIGAPEDRLNIRFSFSRQNTREEIDYTLEKLKLHLAVQVHS